MRFVINRRTFLRRSLAAQIALATGSAYSIALRSAHHEPGRISRAIGMHQLDDTDPNRILDHFYNATIAEYCYYYQEFWPIFGDGSRIPELDTVCATKQTDFNYRGAQKHRLVSLPALARIHALPMLTSDDTADDFQHSIARTHSQLLLSSRGGVESIWQTMTATIIRNHGNWETFTIGNELLDSALLVLERWTDGEPLLYYAAIAVWQFLHTYLSALQDRLNYEEVNRIGKMLQKIRSLVGTRIPSSLPMLTVLDAEYEKRIGFENMIPHISELLIGAQNTVGLPYDVPVRHTDAFLYALNARMENDYLNHLLEAEKITSPLQTVDFSRYSQIQSWSAIAAYGITFEDWARAKDFALRAGFPVRPGRDSYIDERFQTLSMRFQSRDDDNSLDAMELRDLDPFDAYPFRNTNAETIFGKNVGRHETPDLDTLVESGSIPLAALYAKQIEVHANHLARTGDIKIDRAVLGEEIDRVVSSNSFHTHEETFEETRSEYISFRKTEGVPRHSSGSGVPGAPAAAGGGDSEMPGKQSARRSGDAGQYTSTGRRIPRGIDGYRSSELSVLMFQTNANAEEMIIALFDDLDVSDIPWQLLATRAILVPTSEVVRLTHRGLQFDVKDIIDQEKLDQQTLALVRREKFTKKEM